MTSSDSSPPADRYSYLEQQAAAALRRQVARLRGPNDPPDDDTDDGGSNVREPVRPYPTQGSGSNAMEMEDDRVSRGSTPAP